MVRAGGAMGRVTTARFDGDLVADPGSATWCKSQYRDGYPRL